MALDIYKAKKIDGHASILGGPSKARLKRHFFAKKMERPGIYFTVQSNVNGNKNQLKIWVEITSLRALDGARDAFAYEGTTDSLAGFKVVNGVYYCEGRYGSMSFSPAR